MKISNSSVIMSGSHQETSYEYKESMTIEAAKSKDVSAAILTLSEEASGRSLKESMVEYEKLQKQENKQNKKENEARSAKQMAELIKGQKVNNPYKINDETDMKITLLRQILAALQGKNMPKDNNAGINSSNGVLDLRSAKYSRREEGTFSYGAGAALSIGTIEVGTNASGTTWQRITATSGFVCETESTTFASKGLVQTEDGRSMDFNIEVSMSRGFMSKIDTLQVDEYVKTDPLVINLGSDIVSVSDQKFYFDLDSDGEEEQISFVGKDSGFLALDKNGDGRVNDGSELFGTKSGDGFKDLALYDEDGNGWIDENDGVFSKLKIWTKDDAGNDYLIDLKRADVGAIYLGNADTQFSLKDDENNLNAEIKKTGIYLKESTGFAGTVNHLDLVV